MLVAGLRKEVQNLISEVREHHMYTFMHISVKKLCIGLIKDVARLCCDIFLLE